MSAGFNLPLQITLALRDLLWAKAKADDAPASAETHLDSAIDWLAQLCPDFSPHTDEEKEVLGEAREHMDFYRAQRERVIRFSTKS